MTDVDSINKRILIHTSYTPDDFFEIEMPIWLYIFPGKTQSFLIAKNKNSNYSVTVEAGVRAMKINKKIHRIRSKRKVYKIKMRYMLFEY